MAKASEAQEPSMEEILASIRRIISDEDNAAEAEAAAPKEPEPEPEGGGDSGEMNQDDLDALFDAPAGEPEADEPEPEEPAEEEPASAEESLSPDAEREADEAFAKAQQDDTPLIVEAPDPENADVSFAEDEDEDEPLELGPEFEVQAAPEPPAQPRAAPAAAAREPRADERIMSPATDAMVSSAFGNLANMMLSKNARTLEDLVQEMLRPMLREWLDDNLPATVERMVRQEIERVTRGGQP